MVDILLNVIYNKIMKSIIKEIFYGKRGHFENIKGNEEYFNLLGKVADLHKELTEELPEESRNKLQNLCDLLDGMSAELSEEHFVEGVKLGILLGVEAFN